MGTERTGALRRAVQRGPRRSAPCSTCGARTSLARGGQPTCHACVAVLDMRAYFAAAVVALDGTPLELPPLVTVRSLLDAADDADDVIDAEFTDRPESHPASACACPTPQPGWARGRCDTCTGFVSEEVYGASYPGPAHDPKPELEVVAAIDTVRHPAKVRDDEAPLLEG